MTLRMTLLWPLLLIYLAAVTAVTFLFAGTGYALDTVLHGPTRTGRVYAEVVFFTLNVLIAPVGRLPLAVSREQ